MPEPQRQDDPLRGTGRTTARMLRAIAEALEHPNQWVPFRDHRKHAGRDWLWQSEAIQAMCRALHLSIETGLRRGIVHIRSPITRLRQFARAALAETIKQGLAQEQKRDKALLKANRPFARGSKPCGK